MKQSFKYFILFFGFVFITSLEIFHIYMDAAPSMNLRIFYTVVFTSLCFLVPSYSLFLISFNLIIERFSLSFGEFLPNSLLYHILVLSFSLIILNKSILIYKKESLYLFMILIYFSLIDFFFNKDLIVPFSILLALLTLIHLNNYNKQKFISYIFSLISAVSIVCFFAILNIDRVLIDYYTSSGFVERMSFKDSNYTSFLIGLGLLLTIIMYLNNKYKKNLIIIIVLSIVMLLFLLSRGILVAIVVSLLFYFRDKLNRKNIGSLFFVILIIGLTIYFSGLYNNVILRFTSEDISTGSGRTEIWEYGITNFFNNDFSTIVFGRGHGYAFEVNREGFIERSSHNNFLEFLYNYGVTGLLFFIGFFINIYLNSNQKESLSILIFIFISSMSIVPFIYVTPLWFFIPLMILWEKKMLIR